MWLALVLGLYVIAAHNIWAVTLDVIAIGFGGALATVLQTRLMDVAGEAQSLAAALNHSASQCRECAWAVVRRNGGRCGIRMAVDGVSSDAH